MTGTEAELQVREIYPSIQGESSKAGQPCVFVRLTGCSLRCVWCDTQYAFSGGKTMTVEEVASRVSNYGTRLVEVTGGEPLEQAAAIPLMQQLLERGFQVMLETGGHVSIASVPQAVIKILDVKCPGSGEADTFLMENVEIAQPHDEYKFVIASRSDYDWAREFHRAHLSHLPNTVLFSPVHGELDPKLLSEWILADQLPVRLGLQLHKYIWGPDAVGV